MNGFYPNFDRSKHIMPGGIDGDVLIRIETAKTEFRGPQQHEIQISPEAARRLALELVMLADLQDGLEAINEDGRSAAQQKFLEKMRSGRECQMCAITSCHSTLDEQGRCICPFCPRKGQVQS